MANKTYAEKLLDPRWQKKRLEILSRDEFTCRFFEDKTTTLHIHHFNYPKSGNPWDSDEIDLITYCSHCHCLAEYIKKNKPSVIIHDYIYAKKVTHVSSDYYVIVASYIDKRHRICADFYTVDSKDEVSYITGISESILTDALEVINRLKNDFYNNPEN